MRFLSNKIPNSTAPKIVPVREYDMPDQETEMDKKILDMLNEFIAAGNALKALVEEDIYVRLGATIQAVEDLQLSPEAEVNNISDEDANELTGGGETDLHKHAAIDVNITDTGGYYDSTDVEGVLQEVGSELVTHKADTMPHQVQNLQTGKTYRYGLRVTAEGQPQIIYEEVV